MEFPIRYFSSRLHKIAVLAIVLPLSVGIGGLFVAMLSTSVPSNWIVWLIIGCFGILFLVYLILTATLFRSLFSKEPRVALTSTGIIDAVSRTGEIAWSDVEDAALYSGGKFGMTVQLKLRNADKYKAHLSSLRRKIRLNWLEDSTLMLSISGTNAKAEEVLAIIKSQILKSN